MNPWHYFSRFALQAPILHVALRQRRVERVLLRPEPGGLITFAADRIIHTSVPAHPILLPSAMRIGRAAAGFPDPKHRRDDLQLRRVTRA
jgi:hypothetical protein